jgi:hypothetical protein
MRARSLPLPPAEPPDDNRRALQTLSASFAAARGLDAEIRLLASDAPAAPAYELQQPTSKDLQSVFLREAQAGSLQIKAAFAASAVLEILPLIALWRGGRRTPLAIRITEFYRWSRETSAAIRGGTEVVALSMRVLPFNAYGRMEARMFASTTPRHVLPQIEDAMRALPVGQPVRVIRLASQTDTELEMDRPLLEQLEGGGVIVHTEVNEG